MIDEIKEIVLQNLYRAWFYKDQYLRLNKVPEGKEWDPQVFENTVDRLQNDGFIKVIAMGGVYQITAVGILEAEEKGIVPEEITSIQKHLRTLILSHLAEDHEKSGPVSMVSIQTLAAEISDDPYLVNQNLQFLADADYVKFPTFGTCATTYKGLDAVEEWRSRQSVADEFDNLSRLPPHPRGQAFQRIISKKLAQLDWKTEEAARTTNEEMDVIVHKNREYYLVECKWLQDPVEAAVIRELYGKLENRPGVRGMVFSMSGFTKGAVTQAEDYINKREIMLFGEKDINSLFASESTFDKILNQKYHALVVKREIQWQ